MAELKKYIVKGNFLTRGEGRVFVKEIMASSENDAKNKIKSQFGSNYKIRRGRIKVSSVEEVK